MKRFAHHLIRMYPQAWRERYGHELEALLDDTGAHLSHIPNIMWAALRMRLALANWPLIAAFALSGLVVSAVVVFETRYRYVSKAEVSIQIPPAEQVGRRSEFDVVVASVLSREHLIDLMRSPELDLYRQERSTGPMADALERMHKDLSVEVTQPARGVAHAQISYAGETPEQARAVTGAITRAFTDAYANRRSSTGSLRSSTPAVTAPTLPGSPAGVPRWLVLTLGMVAGLVASLIFTAIRRAPRRAVLVAAVLGLAGVAWLKFPPGETVSTKLHVESPAVLELIQDNLPVWLASVERPGYTIAVVPDPDRLGAQVTCSGPSPSRSQQQLGAALTSIAKHVPADRWLRYDTKPLQPGACERAPGCKVGGFVLGVYEFDGIERSAPNAIFAAALLIGIPAVLFEILGLLRKQRSLAPQ